MLEEITADLSDIFLVPVNSVADPNFGLDPGLSQVEVVVGHNPDGSEISKWQAPTKLRIAEEVYLQASEALRSIPYSVRRDELIARFSGNSSEIGRIWALSSMMEAGDLSYISVGKSYLMNPNPAARVTNLILGNALKRGIFGEKDISELKNLLSSSNEHVRDGALDALSRIDSPEARKAIENL